MDETRRLDKLLFDSAVIGALVTMVLFFWGFAFEAFSLANQSLPRQFLREVTVQANVLTGGVLGLFVFFPITIMGYIVDRLTGERVSKRILTMSIFDGVVTALFFLVLSVGVIALLSRLPGKYITPQQYVVARIAVKGTESSTYPGLFFVTKKDGVYVFVDTVHSDRRSIHIVREDQVTELILVPRKEEERDSVFSSPTK